MAKNESMEPVRERVKALLMSYWVFMPGDIVQGHRLASAPVLQPGEKAKILTTFYMCRTTQDTGEVVKEAWVNLEVTTEPHKGLRCQDYLANVMPHDWKVGAGPGNGGRSFDDFVKFFCKIPPAGFSEYKGGSDER